MTVMDTDEDLKIFELFDFDVACQFFRKKQCPNEAKYHVETKCCQVDNMLCKEHMDYILTWEIPEFGFLCAHCKGFKFFKSIEEWVTITPI